MSSLALHGGGSLRRMKGSGGSIGRRSLGEQGEKTSHHFRIARIGPGWVVGTIEGASGVQNPGYHVAGTLCLFMSSTLPCYSSSLMLHLPDLLVGVQLVTADYISYLSRRCKR
jgi:hypothetical protein